MVVFCSAHGGIGAAARERDAIERHALNAAAEQLGLLGRDGAGVDAHPGDLRRQAPVFDFRAAVHHDLDAVRFRELRRLVAADAELHPDHLRARRKRERLLDDAEGVLRGAEDVDHVDRLGDVAKLGVDFLSEQVLAGEPGVHRDHVVAALEQILEGEIARTAGIGRDPDHRDRLHGVEDAADVAVVVAVVIHWAPPSTANIGAAMRVGKGQGAEAQAVMRVPRPRFRAIRSTRCARAAAHSPLRAPRSAPAARRWRRRSRSR